MFARGKPGLGHKNGTARRTINLSAFSRGGIRETHHTRSAAKIARTVPANKLKGTIDCVYGYHGWSWPRRTTTRPPSSESGYKHIPQGYRSSGDGFTMRPDDIIYDCPDKPEEADLESLLMILSSGLTPLNKPSSES